MVAIVRGQRRFTEGCRFKESVDWFIFTGTYETWSDLTEVYKILMAINKVSLSPVCGRPEQDSAELTLEE